MSFQLISLERINSFPIKRLENPLFVDWLQARYDWIKCANGKFHAACDCAVCEHCDDCFCNDELTQVFTSCGRRQNRTSEFLCESCLNHSFACGDCNDRFADNCQGGSNTNAEPVCERCAEHYSCCERCNNTVACEDLNEDGRCQNCSPRNRNRNGILPYSTDVSLPFFGKGPIFFGVELEVERNPDADDDLPGVRNAVGGWAILKDDNSLNDGYEIVTAPMDIQSHLKYWPNFLAASEGLLSFKTKTCGLHVHVSRRPLSQLQIAKIVCFVNSAANRDFMVTIAQRNSDQWSKYSEKKLSDSAKKDVSRYQAVNLLNDETIEFRIFKGTLKQSSLFSAIEFCEAIVNYCEPSSRPIQWCLDSIRFCEFVSENRKRWPHLAEFIKTKWITKWLDNNTDSTNET